MSFGRKKGHTHDDPLAAFRRLDKPTSDGSDSVTVRKHEDEAAKVIGGERHAGSGASPWLKSDASSETYQLECKQTAHASMTIQWGWLEKISMEAAGQGKTPALHVRFLRENPGVSKDWVMLPAAEFERLLAGRPSE